jgi:hypothetical protein
VTELGSIKWINSILSTWVSNGVIGKERRPDKDRKERLWFVPISGGASEPIRENMEDDLD